MRQGDKETCLQLIFDLSTRSGTLSASHPGHALLPGKEPGWFGLRVALDTEAREKMVSSAGDRIPIVQSIVRH
jgi:hypothetical protein